MPDENDKFWEKEKGKLRRALDLHPLCQDESEKEYKRAKAEPLSEDDIDAVLAFVRSMGERGGMAAPADEDEEDEDAPPEWVDPVDAGMMEEEMLQLNRNAGVEDEETKDLLDKHRREALGDDTADEDHGGRGEDAPGLADREDPDGAGR